MESNEELIKNLIEVIQGLSLNVSDLTEQVGNLKEHLKDLVATLKNQK